MAVAFVKKNSGQSGGSSTTLTATLASAPASGNLLVFAMGGDKNTGALTLAGFTQAYELLSTSVSLYLYYKVSNGTETAISPTWATTSTFGNTYWYGEYQDAAVSGSTWLVSGQASNITNESTVSSVSTGTTGTLTDDGLAIAAAAIDNAQNAPDGTTAFSNSFTARHLTLVGAGARGGIYLAEKTVTAGTTTNSTFSYTPGTTDQMSGAIVVFAKVSEDFDTEGRLRGAASLYAETGYESSADAHLTGGGRLAAEYVKHVTPGGFLAGGGFLAAAVGHSVDIEGRLTAAPTARAVLSAGPNDVALAARLTAGLGLRAAIGQHFPSAVPAGRTHRITVPSRVYTIPGGNQVGLSKTFTADESDDLDYRYDWTRVLEDGETIVTSVIEAPDGITVHDQTNGPETTDVWFTGGSVGATYLIPNRIVTSEGRTYERNIELKVRDR